jgi:hypothetical protein
MIASVETKATVPIILIDLKLINYIYYKLDDDA